MYEADAVAELSDSGDESAPVALVVHEEPLIRQLVSTVLRRRGWSIVEAADGSMALLVVGGGPADSLGSDFEVPVISGVRLAEQLRQRDEEMPVLVGSGRPEAARKMRSLNGPRTASVSKPFPVEALISSMDRS